MCAAVRSTRYDIRRDFRCLHNQYIDKRPRMCEWFSATGGGGSCGTTEICTFWNNDAGYLPNTHQRSKFHVDLSEFTGNNLGLLAFSMAWHEDFIDNNSGGPEIVKNVCKICDFSRKMMQEKSIILRAFLRQKLVENRVNSMQTPDFTRQIADFLQFCVRFGVFGCLHRFTGATVIPKV